MKRELAQTRDPSVVHIARDSGYDRCWHRRYTQVQDKRHLTAKLRAAKTQVLPDATAFRRQASGAFLLAGASLRPTSKVLPRLRLPLCPSWCLVLWLVGTPA